MQRPANAENWNGPYLQKRGGLMDPWGVGYLYRIPGENNHFDVYTLGADKQPGGVVEVK